MGEDGRGPSLSVGMQMHPTARGPRRMSKSEATCRRGVCPSRVVRNVSEAHASPADRGFGRMARWLGRIPCRIARPVDIDWSPCRSSARRRYPLPMPGSFQSLAEPAKAPPRVLAASPANRIMPSCFRPGPARLPTHPTSTAPTTRHDLACGAADGGESHGSGVRGIRFTPTTPTGVIPAKAGT
jgi:hypothetical protein